MVNVQDETTFGHLMYQSLVLAMFGIPTTIVLLMLVLLLVDPDSPFLIDLVVVLFLSGFHVLLYRVARFKTVEEQRVLTFRSSVVLAVYYGTHVCWCIACGLAFVIDPFDHIVLFWCMYILTYVGFVWRPALLILIYFEPMQTRDAAQETRLREETKTMLDPENDVLGDEGYNPPTSSSCFGKLMFKSLFVSMIFMPGYFFVDGIFYDGTLGAPVGMICGTISFFWVGYHLFLLRETIYKNQQRHIHHLRNYYLSRRMSVVLLAYYFCCGVFLWGMEYVVALALMPVLALLLFFLAYCEPTGTHSFAQ